MPSSFGGLGIAVSGLKANERGLIVIGHNISNVNTKGYVRQQTTLISSATVNVPVGVKDGQVGTGVDYGQITQAKDLFIDTIYRKENTNLGYWQTINNTLQDIQSIIKEPMDNGLQNTFDKFWGSWQELSKTPESIPARSLVKANGQMLADNINDISQHLDKLQLDINSKVENVIDSINTITTQVATLNYKILSNQASDGSANDYVCQRDMLLNDLANFIDIDINNQQDGQVEVSTSGYDLVLNNKNYELSLGQSKTATFFGVPILKDRGIPIYAKSGQLRGLLESRGEVPGLSGTAQNGSPDTSTDITFAIDVSNTSSSYLSNIQNSISKCVNELNLKGIDYNLKLVTYGDTVHLNNNYGSYYNSFMVDINNLTATTDANKDFSAVANLLSSATDYRDGANKYALIFTGESVDGDTVLDSDATISNYANELYNAGIKTSVITNQSDYYTGQPAGENSGWNVIASGTNGNLYDINSTDYSSLMTSIADDINTNLNESISNLTSTNNPIVDLKRRLNAQINIILREINYLHKSGKTITNPPTSGQDFFVPIDSSQPHH